MTCPAREPFGIVALIDGLEREIRQLLLLEDLQLSRAANPAQ
jgi:hypothetical protein